MRNTPLVAIGLLFVVLGTVALFSRELTYRQRETVVEVVPLRIIADTPKTVPLWPIFGGIGVVVGVASIAAGVWMARFKSSNRRT